MDQEALMELLHAHEWRDVEFKEARQAVPSSAYETVSAFANTDGGHLVFGVKQRGQDVELVGVLNVDKVQGDFLTTLRQREKISAQLDVREDLHEHEGADLLLFYIPEASRADKPVYLNGDIRRAFVRSGGSDVRCSENERNRFLMDAAGERYDGQAIDLPLDDAFDQESLRWYRAVYEARPGNRSHSGLSDADFLAEMGLLIDHDRRLRPTRAAILLFGTNPAFRQLLPRMVVDCQRFAVPRDEAEFGERWFDRMELDENLVRVWRALVYDWYPRIAEHPFRVDPITLRRDDTPPDYHAFREAMVNLVLHQDYADHTRKAVIKHYPDQTVFWNPGDAFATDADLLEPGEKEVRNPRLVLAFRRIGMSENAGWGLRDMFRNWRNLGNAPPTIDSDKRRKAFEVVLRKDPLLNDEQIEYQRSLGVQLTHDQAEAFAYLCRVPSATFAEMKVVTGHTAAETQRMLEVLRTHVLVQLDGHGRYCMARQLVSGRRSGLGEHATASAAGVEGVGYSHPAVVGSGLSDADAALQQRVVQACDVPRSSTELADMFEQPRRNFRSRHIQPLLDTGVLRPTNPKNPNARNQRYVLTEAGVALKAEQMAEIKGRRRGEG